MPDLFATYPELAERISALCDGRPWNVIGVSALVSDQEALYFEITPPRPPRNGQPSPLLCGIGGIGGKINPGETMLACLHREVAEELQARIAISSARSIPLLYEQRLADTLALAPRDHPLPAFCTINRYRAGGRVYPDRFGVIVTFGATLLDAPERDDLFGLLRVPHAALPQVFGAPELTLARLGRIDGVSVQTREPVPADAHLFTVWTARSFQLLWQAHLADGLPGTWVSHVAS
jgi:8-oxo-dGTP pyrophosphatase MutT (NUDIX family)